MAGNNEVQPSDQLSRPVEQKGLVCMQCCRACSAVLAALLGG